MRHLSRENMYYGNCRGGGVGGVIELRSSLNEEGRYVHMYVHHWEMVGMNAVDTYVVGGAGRGEEERKERGRWREGREGERRKRKKGREAGCFSRETRAHTHTHEQYFD